jgi:transposase-like protein
VTPYPQCPGCLSTLVNPIRLTRTSIEYRCQRCSRTWTVTEPVDSEEDDETPASSRTLQ